MLCSRLAVATGFLIVSASSVNHSWVNMAAAPPPRRASYCNILDIFPADSDPQHVSRTKPKLSRSLSCIIQYNPTADPNQPVAAASWRPDIPDAGAKNSLIQDQSLRKNLPALSDNSNPPMDAQILKGPMAFPSSFSESPQSSVDALSAASAAAEQAPMYPIRLEVVKERGLVCRLASENLSDRLVRMIRRHRCVVHVSSYQC